MNWRVKELWDELMVLKLEEKIVQKLRNHLGQDDEGGIPNPFARLERLRTEKE
jgi:hypothetical protein